MSNKRSDKWLLVQWVSGSRSIVEWKSVISPVEDTNVVGSVVVASNGQGAHEAATVICSAHKREVLEKQISPNAPAHLDNDEKDDDEDFSASGSSWAPSDENVSSDDEQVSRKKIKLEPSSNDNGGRRVMKPSHRADVINNMLQKHYKNKFSDVKNNTQNVNGSASDKKSVTDAKKNKDKTPNAKSDIVSIKVRDIQDMKKCFHDLFQLLKEIKTSFSPHPVPTTENSTAMEEQGLDIKVKDFFSLNQTEENNGYASDRSRSEELNRSEDNVLITNKYENRKKSKSKNKKNTKENKTHKPMRVLNENHNNTFHRGDNWIPIGSGKTLIHQYRYNKVNWKSYTVATRTLLAAAFPRRVLATHSLTGKKSPAFQDLPPKMRLDPKIVSDIVLEITERFNVKGNLVRTIITTKCADESKTFKTKLLQRDTKGNVDVDTDDENYFANLTC